MIHYTLRCATEHSFDGWFKDSAAFDAQSERGLVTCPECGESRVTRGLMAPAIPRKGRASSVTAVEPSVAAEVATEKVPNEKAATEKAATGLPDQMRAALQRVRAEIERTSDYVGPAFAEEARRIHRGDSDKRNIYGESTAEQAEALAEEGIAVARIPWVPRADG